MILIYGSSDFSSTIDLYDHNITGQGLGLRFRGANDGDGVGFYVAAGNINGDGHPDTGVGYADILVGVYLESSNEDGFGYVLYGGPEITAGVTITPGTWTVPISDCADITLYPARAGDRLGRSVFSGDLNADGYDDFAFGASRADSTITRTNAGETYVFYGGPHLSPTVAISPTGNTDLTVLGDRANGESGRSMTIGYVTVYNLPPVADAGGPYTGEAGVPILLSAAASFDPGPADLLTYHWDWESDGVIDVVTNVVTVTHTWDGTGVYIVTLRVTDGDGGEDTDTARVTVDPADLVRIEIAPTAAAVTAGDTQSYTVTAFDALDNAWDATDVAVYAIETSAGGSWTANSYVSEKAGAWVVTATYGAAMDTATLTVASGTLDHVALTPAEVRIVAGEYMTYTVSAFDAHGNFIADVTASSVFSHPVEAGGSWTGDVYTSEHVRDWIITAIHQDISADALLHIAAKAPEQFLFLPLVQREE